MGSAAILASAIINQNHPPVMKDEFSLYLTLIKEGFPPNLTSDPNHSLSKIVSGRKRIGGGEIDIFGAEKYFNGSMDSTSELEKGGAKNNLNSGGSVSTTCSGSSGNSQSRLLKDPHKRFSSNQSKQNNGRGRIKVGFLRVLWCSSCSGENAVEVDPDDSICKNSVKVEIFENREGEFLCKNVMGRGTSRTESFSSGFEREKAPFFPKSNLGKDLGSQFFVKEEMGSSRMSESSSELFEIETLTVNPGESREEAESPTRYQPSEASVVWSVVTANTTTAPIVEKKPSRPQRSSLLLGCASEKAVDATVGFRSMSRV